MNKSESISMFEQKQVIQLNVNLSREMFRNLPGFIQFEQQADAFFLADDLARREKYNGKEASDMPEYGMNFSRSIWNSFLDEIDQIISKEFEGILALNHKDDAAKVIYNYSLVPYSMRFESYHQDLIEKIQNFLAQALPILSNHYLNMNQCDKWCDVKNKRNLMYGLHKNQMTFFFDGEIVEDYKKVLLNARLENELPENQNQNQVKTRSVKL